MLYDSHVIYDLKHQMYDQGELGESPYILNVNVGKHHSHSNLTDPWSYLQIISAMGNVRNTIEDSIIGVYSGGRNWLPTYVMGLLNGGNLFRVGIEDTYWKYPHKDEVIQKNSEIVELAVDIAESLGREVITDPAEAREFLDMKYTS
jgi:uncharacterized protein (DUF849 family)